MHKNKHTLATEKTSVSETVHPPSSTHHGEGGGGLLQETNQADFGKIFPGANPLLVWRHHVIGHCGLLQNVGGDILQTCK